MAHQIVRLRDQRGVEHEVEAGVGASVVADGRMMSVSMAGRGEIRVGERTVFVAARGSERWVFIDGNVYILELVGAAAPLAQRRDAAGRPRTKTQRDGTLTAPMPATVAKLAVTVGDQVKAGDVLIILEAMKMELPVRATADGVVRSVRCREGELVQPGEELVELATAAESAP